MLALVWRVGSARAEEIAPEVQRASEGAREARERADRLRKGGREDLAKLADELAEARTVVAAEAERTIAAEREASEAEEAQLEALKQLDRATAAREERRERLARLADQTAQAEGEAKAPVIVSMPKARRSSPARPSTSTKKGGAK
jgi:hypothetical protein